MISENTKNKIFHKKNFITTSTNTSTALTKHQRNTDIVSITPSTKKTRYLKKKIFKFFHKGKKVNDLLPTINLNGVDKYPLISCKLELENALLKPGFEKKIKKMEEDYMKRKENVLKFGFKIEQKKPDIEEICYFPKPSKNVNYCRKCHKDLGNNPNSYIHFISREHLYNCGQDKNFEKIFDLNKKFQKFYSEKNSKKNFEKNLGKKNLENARKEMETEFNDSKKSQKGGQSKVTIASVKFKNSTKQTKKSQFMATIASINIKPSKPQIKFSDSPKKVKSQEKMISQKSISKKFNTDVSVAHPINSVKKSKKFHFLKFGNFRRKSVFSQKKKMKFLDEEFLCHNLGVINFEQVLENPDVIKEENITDEIFFEYKKIMNELEFTYKNSIKILKRINNRLSNGVN